MCMPARSALLLCKLPSSFRAHPAALDGIGGLEGSITFVYRNSVDLIFSSLRMSCLKLADKQLNAT